MQRSVLKRTDQLESAPKRVTWYAQWKWKAGTPANALENVLRLQWSTDSLKRVLDLKVDVLCLVARQSASSKMSTNYVDILHADRNAVEIFAKVFKNSVTEYDLIYLSCIPLTTSFQWDLYSRKYMQPSNRFSTVVLLGSLPQRDCRNCTVYSFNNQTMQTARKICTTKVTNRLFLVSQTSLWSSFVVHLLRSLCFHNIKCVF